MDWTSILISAVASIVGVLVILISVFGNYYTKKIDHKLKMKSLTDEINRYVQWSQGSKTFAAMAQPERMEVLVKQLQLFAEQNDILIMDTQLRMMIESSITPLMKLENSGKQLLKLKRG